ncbi:MAG: DUF3987 domain-containing protein, partial [Magnetococcales bacterium]|nr:DUF3987 domain-containing protein [Magnetococcales bacterium]
CGAPRPAPRRRGGARMWHGALEQWQTDLTAANAAGAGVFFMVNRGDGQGRRRANVTDVRALFVDLDGAPLESLLQAPLAPHWLVASSPGRYHAYWRVTGLPLARFGVWQSHLARRFGGDPAVKDLPRLMRLPGFLHRKGRPFLCQPLGEPGSGGPWSEQQMAAAFGWPDPVRSRGGPPQGEVPPLGIPQGARDQTLFRYAQRLCKQGLSRDEGALLVTRAAESCRPPFPVAEAIARVERVWSHAQAVGPDWPAPAPLERRLPPAPAFPLACLPAPAAQWARDVAWRGQGPVDLVAVPMLVVLAGLIGRQVVLRLKGWEEWQERACLWGLVVMDKGAMKTPLQRIAAAPLITIQSRWHREDLALLRQWEADQDGKKPSRGHRSRAGRAPPEQRWLLIQDATQERLAEMMAQSRGMTLIRDELAGFLTSLNRYGQGGDRQFYLECHAGGAYTVARIGRGERVLEDLYLNILGGLQPAVGARLFAAEAEQDDGLLERFGVLTHPAETDGFELVRQPPDRAAREGYEALCQRLADSDWRRILPRGGAEGAVCFARESQARFDRWLEQHMNQLGRHRGTPLAGFMNKGRGLLGRLALVLHLGRWAAGQTDDPREVEPATLEQAIGLLEEYLIPMWRRVTALFAHPIPPAEAPRLPRLGRFLQAWEGDSVRVADITRRQWPGLATSAEVTPLFQRLVEHDWLGEPLEAGGRRITAPWPINPRIRQPAVPVAE